jgi:hypothetical protein
LRTKPQARRGHRLDADDRRPSGGAVAGCRGGKRADADRYEHQVVLSLRSSLLEQSRVAVDHPFRRAARSDIGDQEHARFLRLSFGLGNCVFVGALDDNDLGAFALDRFPPHGKSPLGKEDAHRSPRISATRATARPWLPALAATSVCVSGLSRSARSTAHDAPRILKAGRPSRDDSSFTSTASTPSTCATPLSSLTGVGL